MDLRLRRTPLLEPMLLLGMRLLLDIMLLFGKGLRLGIRPRPGTMLLFGVIVRRLFAPDKIK